MQAAGIQLSIIVPTYRRPERLAECLESLAALDYPRDRFEVVVVDDGSENPAQAIVDGFRDRLTTTFVRQQNQGPAAARNKGAKVAKGPILVFTDDDCRPDPTWLKEIVSACAGCEGAAIGGAIVNGLPDNVFSAASQVLVTYLYAHYEVGHASQFFCSNNLAFPARRFWEIGGFDEQFTHPAGEDREICERWRNAGYRAVYAPRAIVRHFHAMNVFGFLRQHFRYGEGAFGLTLRRRQLTGGGLRPEPVGFYVNLLRSPFEATDSVHPWIMSGLLAICQFLSAFGFVWGWLEHSRAQRARRNNT